MFRLIASVCLLAAAAACHDLLDEHPQTFIDPGSYFKTGDQAIAAVNGIYGALMTWDDWIDPAWQEVTCEGSDIFCPDWWAFGHLGAKTGTWFAGRTWTANYQVIRRANDVLGQLDRVSLDTALTRRLRGEAHFLRGYAYFELVRRYGAVPLRLPPYVPDGTYGDAARVPIEQSEEHTSELQSRELISYAVFCLKKKMLCPCVCGDLISSNLRKTHCPF